MEIISETAPQDPQALARSYFPDDHLGKADSDLETKDKVTLLFQKEELLPYLQTMLFEEHLVEIQVDQGARLFFSYVLDAPPPPMEEGPGDPSASQDPYEPGSYLKAMESLLMNPVTPGIGNLVIRNAKQIILRFYTGTTSVELGCTFLRQDVLENDPVLRFSFPVIGKIAKIFRGFRVRALNSVEAKVRIQNSSPSKGAEALYQICDVSAEGMAFELPGEELPFRQGDMISLMMMVKGTNHLAVNGHIRNITSVRNSNTKGYKTICGIRFDLETRALAKDLEKLAAAIQRLHLRELGERTADLKGVRIIR